MLRILLLPPKFTLSANLLNREKDKKIEMEENVTEGEGVGEQLQSVENSPGSSQK